MILQTQIRFSVFLIALSAISCASHRVYPRFTSSLELVGLSGADDLESAQRRLGCAPYDLYLSQKDGYSIYHWYYKREAREVAEYRMRFKDAQNEGEVRLEKDLNSAYLIFDRTGSLSSVVTRSGRGDAIGLTLFSNDVAEAHRKRIHVWFDQSTRKAVTNDGLSVSYDQIMLLIERLFDGDKDVNIENIYEYIDNFLEQ